MAVSFVFMENSSSPWHTRQVNLVRWTQWENITGTTFFAVDVLSIATSPYSSGESNGGRFRSPWENAEGEMNRSMIHATRQFEYILPALLCDLFMSCSFAI